MEDIIVADKSVGKLKYYIVKQSKFYDELNLETFAYGIQIEAEKDSTVEKSFVSDITCSSEEINEIITLLEKNKVFPVHLEDIILDLLS